MQQQVKTEATLEDLYRVPEHGKAELVRGELILMPPTGGSPGYAAGEIFASLREYARHTQRGHALPDYPYTLPHFYLNTGVQIRQPVNTRRAEQHHHG
jgi:Uma2 family endonuclease